MAGKVCLACISETIRCKVPLQVLKELEHQARQNVSTINFTSTFGWTASSCNTVMEKCLHSAKATFKRVKIQIQRDKAVETPSPNDTFQASLSPPVGGCLRSFRRDWLMNKCSSNMLHIITNGYVLQFISKPNLVRAPLIQSGYKALHKELALTSYMQSFLSKNARERVENVKSLGFYSRLFLIPKPHQR